MTKKPITDLGNVSFFDFFRFNNLKQGHIMRTRPLIFSVSDIRFTVRFRINPKFPPLILRSREHPTILDPTPYLSG